VDSEVETAFQTLKGALYAAPFLAYPKPGERFIVDTDASNFAIRGVLSQMQDGQERVIAYYSKTLNRKKLLRYLKLATGHSVDTAKLDQVSVCKTVIPAHGPVCAKMAHEF
jgi:hypothetical protein